MKDYLLRLSKKYPAFGWAKKIYQSTRDWYYSIQPINQKLVVLEAFRGTKYADSPKAIYEYMLESPEYDNYKFIWVFEHPENYHHLVSKRTRVVKYESHAHYMAFSRAKYWIVNGWLSLRFFKKPGQVMLQCWHGTPLKRLRYDIIESADTIHRPAALRDNDADVQRYDYFISPSKFATKAFTSAFNLKALNKQDIIIETGYPRNDFLVNHTAEDADSLRSKYDIAASKKVILYAPTWRDDQSTEGGGYSYTLPVDFDHLKKTLGDQYVILFRTHNLIANSIDFSSYKGFVHDVSQVDDVNELYVISDVLVTDYSSVFFDYANLQRPIIFYMYDKDHYMNGLRGFYLDTDSLPGRIVTNENDLAKQLIGIDDYISVYKDKLVEFSKSYNYLDDGCAADRVTEIAIG